MVAVAVPARGLAELRGEERELERSGAAAAESAGMMPTLKPKHRPFCFSVKGHVKMLRLVRPGHRVGAVLGRAQGQREIALKYKEESSAFFFGLGLPKG